MLENLFSPKSVAIIGASKTAGKVGHDILDNLVKGGFGGTIIPVNPSGGKIFKIPVCKNLQEHEGDIDQVIIAVPKNYVLDAVTDAIAKKAETIIDFGKKLSEMLQINHPPQESNNNEN